MANSLEVALAAARDAGAILRERLGKVEIGYKGPVDLVTDADRASEALIAARIREAFPDHRLLGEEGARGAPEQDGAAPAPYGWLVDPLDGTTNYAHGYPHFAVSIALEREGTVLLGVVYDPMRDELFVAERGKGATLNGLPLRVSGVDQLIQALLATGFPYDFEARAETTALWNVFLNQTQGTRRDGSAALNLCYVAAGRLDGFFERPLWPWDIGAGSLIIEEAGGRVTDYADGPFTPYRREIVASNAHLHDAILAVIAQHQSDPTRLVTPDSVGGVH